MTVYIQLTTAGTNTGPFNLFSDVDGYTTAFESGVAKSALVAGYTSALVPNGTTTIRVQSVGACTNYIDIVIGATTTTTTTTSGEGVILSFYYRGATSGSGANNQFVYELSGPLPSNITVSSGEVSTYLGLSCSAPNDSDLSGSTVITAGSLSANFVSTKQFCDDRYQRVDYIIVNGNNYNDGDTFTIGGTPVTVFISPACQILGCIF